MRRAVAKKILFEKKLKFRILKKRYKCTKFYYKVVETIGPNKWMILEKKISYKWCINKKECKGKIIDSYACTKIGSLDTKNWGKTYWIQDYSNG